MRVRPKKTIEARRLGTPTRRPRSARQPAPSAPCHAAGLADLDGVAEPADIPAGPEARVRQAGGPDDRAVYRCACGYVFEAPVSTSVACPNCGGGQAW